MQWRRFSLHNESNDTVSPYPLMFRCVPYFTKLGAAYYKCINSTPEPSNIHVSNEIDLSSQRHGYIFGVTSIQIKSFCVPLVSEWFRSVSGSGFRTCSAAVHKWHTHLKRNFQSISNIPFTDTVKTLVFNSNDRSFNAYSFVCHDP